MCSVLALLTMTLSLQVNRPQRFGYLLSISPPFCSCLTGCVQKLESVAENRALLFCHVSNGLISLVSHFQHQFFWMHYFSVILIFLFVIFYGIGPCEYINGNVGRKFCIILVGDTTSRGRTDQSHGKKFWKLRREGQICTSGRQEMDTDTLNFITGHRI